MWIFPMREYSVSYGKLFYPKSTLILCQILWYSVIMPVFPGIYYELLWLISNNCPIHLNSSLYATNTYTLKTLTFHLVFVDLSEWFAHLTVCEKL